MTNIIVVKNHDCPLGIKTCLVTELSLSEAVADRASHGLVDGAERELGSQF